MSISGNDVTVCCDQPHDLSNLSSSVKCGINQVLKSVTIGDKPIFSVQHRIEFSNFQQLSFGDQYFTAISLIDETAFDHEILRGKAWFVTIGSSWDQLVAQQTVGPIRALQDVAHLYFRRSLFQESNYCFVVHSLQDYVESDSIHTEGEGDASEKVVLESFLDYDLVQKGSANSLISDQLESKYWRMRNELNQSLIHLGAVQIAAQNYKLMYFQSLRTVSEIKRSLSWRITSPIRFVARNIKSIMK